MKKLVLILPVLMAASASAYAMTCIPLTGNDDFNRVSSTEVLVTNGYNQTFQMTVATCPELMMDEPIVVAPEDDELCASDVLRVGDDICPIESIVQVSPDSR